jgi:hypothetical protein
LSRGGQDTEGLIIKGKGIVPDLNKGLKARNGTVLWGVGKANRPGRRQLLSAQTALNLRIPSPLRDPLLVNSYLLPEGVICFYFLFI